MPHDPICPCTLIRREHRRSAHESVDYREVLETYLFCADIPLDVHARAVERMYTLQREKEARAVQKAWERSEERRRHVAVRRVRGRA